MAQCFLLSNFQDHQRFHICTSEGCLHVRTYVCTYVDEEGITFQIYHRTRLHLTTYLPGRCFCWGGHVIVQQGLLHKWCEIVSLVWHWCAANAVITDRFPNQSWWFWRRSGNRSGSWFGCWSGHDSHLGRQNGRLPCQIGRSQLVLTPVPQGTSCRLAHQGGSDSVPRLNNVCILFVMWQTCDPIRSVTSKTVSGGWDRPLPLNFWKLQITAFHILCLAQALDEGTVWGDNLVAIFGQAWSGSGSVAFPKVNSSKLGLLRIRKDFWKLIQSQCVPKYVYVRTCVRT